MLLVVGGTGELGGRVVRLLLERGHEVRCLVRAGSNGERLEELGAKVVRGDLTDPGSLVDACQGVETVIATATAIARRLAGVPGPSIHETDELGMASLVDAAESAGVRRFVYLSYAGVDAGFGTPIEKAKSQRNSGSHGRGCDVSSSGRTPSRRSISDRWDGST